MDDHHHQSRSRSYWIQNNNNNNKDTTLLNSHVFGGDSWEEQAFAEDAAGPLGGCIWPPRSYTCSFCRREFRSAQALGGHMNVHRRDRARLKQISSPKSNQQPNSSLIMSRCVLEQNPNEICNPNFDLDHNSTTLFSSPSSTVSILTTPFTCSFAQLQDNQKGSGSTTPILSWSKFESRKRFHFDDLGDNYYQEKSCTKVVDSKKGIDDQRIEVHSTGNLNSLVRRRRSQTPDEPDDGDRLFSKRRRTDDYDAKSFFEKNSNMMVKGDEDESLVVVIQPVERSPNSTLENLDLELRLGDRP